MLKAKPKSFDSLSTPEFMEDDVEEETPKSPFWIQTTTTTTRCSISALLFNSLVLIIFLLLIAIVSMVFIIPSIIDYSSHIFKPNLVKRSWDSINLLLVLIALLFGFLSRNINNDEKVSYDNGYDRSEPELTAGPPIMSPENSIPHQWYDLQDDKMKSDIGLRRQKTSSSYPDLRELSPPWKHRDAVDPWRFSDDTHLNYYRVLESNRNYVRQRSRRIEIQENPYTMELPPPEKDFYFPPPSPPYLPPQPPAHTVKKKTKRVYDNVAKEDGERCSNSGNGKMMSPETESSEKKGGRGERKRGNGEKRRARSSEPRRILSPVIDPLPEPSSPPPVSPLTERKRNGGSVTKDFFTSFYHKKKKKLQRGRSVDNIGSLLHHSQSPAVKIQLPPPSPPPPPPSAHNNLFPSRKDNKKKFISVTIAPPAPSPPPPPPPPPPRTANRAPRPTITRLAPFVTEKPRTPFPLTSFNGIDDSSSGGESPMKQIPPPPPLPPFIMPDWKFAVEGDFVRLQSTLSSRSVSPDGDEARSPSSDVDIVATAVAPPVFFPSPDVDTKADSFIAKFRAGLKLERMSKLGPGPDPNET